LQNIAEKEFSDSVSDSEEDIDEDFDQAANYMVRHIFCCWFKDLLTYLLKDLEDDEGLNAGDDGSLDDYEEI
jgi:hypothetical protein